MATLNEGLLMSLERVRKMRGTLRRLILSLSPEQLTMKHDWCGTESVLDTLLHVIDCEFLWIQGVLSRKVLYEFPDSLRRHFESEQLRSIPAKPGAIYAEALGLSSDITRVFAFQDALTESTCAYVRDTNLWDEQDYTFPWRPEKTERFSPWLILNHVITHEFHHKGQIVGMCRAMGITDIPETDFA